MEDKQKEFINELYDMFCDLYQDDGSYTDEFEAKIVTKIESYGEAKKLEGKIEENEYWLKEKMQSVRKTFEERIAELTQQLETIKSTFKE